MSGLRIQYDAELNDNGLPVLDEFVARSATVHFEAMGDADWWIGVYLQDGRSFMLNFGVADFEALKNEHGARSYAFVEVGSA